MTHCIFIKKILNKCNLIPVVLYVSFFTLPAVTLAQQRKTGWNQSLTLPVRTLRLDSLSNLLARKTGFMLSFNAGTINPGTKITFAGTEVGPDTLLPYLQKHYGLSHKKMGNHIILYRHTTSNDKVQITEKIHKPHISRKEPDIPDKRKVAGVMPLKKEIEPLRSSVLPNIETGISLSNLSPPPLTEVGKVLSKQNHISKAISIEPESYSKRSPAHLSDKPDKVETQGDGFSRSNDRFFASAGLASSEVFYVNPQIRVGLPLLFVLVAWETNFKASGFFYGLGTSIKVSDNWDFQLSASGGALSKDFRWPTRTSDTIGRVKAGLLRINIQAEKHLSERWMFQFGPVLNFMRSRYSLKNLSMANSFPPPDDLSKDIYILNPPYILSNIYKEKTGSGKKIWIGFQIGLFYRLW